MRRVFRWLATQVYLTLHRPFLRRHLTHFSQILKEPKRIILRLPTAPGELLFAIPTLQVIRKVYRDSRIFLLVSEERKILLQGNHHFDGITLDDHRTLPFTPTFFRWKRHLRRQGFDLFIDLCPKNGNRGRLISLLSGAKVRIGRDEGEPFYNCEIYGEEAHRDEVEKHLFLVSTFLPDSGNRVEGIPFFLFQKRTRVVRDFLRFQGVKEGEILVGVDLHQWDRSFLLRLLRSLEELYSPRILLLGSLDTLPPKGLRARIGRGHQARMEEIHECLKKVPIHIPSHLKLECPEMVKECHLFLSFKTDFFSIAYALEVPTILFLRQSEVGSFRPPTKETFKPIILGKKGDFPLKEVLKKVKELLGMEDDK